ncbi:MAG: hypothetical protein ACREBU_05575 [Nitrososphaera sp.]
MQVSTQQSGKYLLILSNKGDQESSGRVVSTNFTNAIGDKVAGLLGLNAVTGGIYALSLHGS